MLGLYFIVTVFYFNIYTPCVSALGCEDSPLGMQNNVIPDNKITASSGRAGNQARLNTNGSSWCAMGNDSNPYLQIDLGTPHIICAVSTQGDYQAKQWVKTFQLSSSDNGMSFVNYSEFNDGNSMQTFYGNADGSGIVKQILYKGIIARYLRILPKMHHGAVCMRAEIYGIRIQSDNLALQKTATQSTTTYNGVASRAVDGNHNKTWLGNSCTHCGQTDPEGEWWRVDLGIRAQVAGVSIFTPYIPVYGGRRLWDFLFEIRIGYDTSSPTANPRCGGEYGIIPAGSITIVCHPPINGRYVTIRQLTPYQQLSLCEVEVYGVNSEKENNRQVCVRLPIGVSNIPDNRLSASSVYNNTRSSSEARFHGDSSWRPRDDDSNPWLQIDLVDIYYVCAVATQGDRYSDQRTRKYKMKWTMDGYNWKYVTLQMSQKNGTIFTGNRDRKSIIKHIVPRPLVARKIRFYPLEKNEAYALRVEIYGVMMGPSKLLPIGSQMLEAKKGSYVDLVCRGNRGQSIKWYYNDTEITRYSNGTVRSGPTLISKLRVNYTSADDVYDKYSCGEVSLQKRRCTSLEYICQVDYGSYGKRKTRGKVTIELGVEEQEIVEDKKWTKNSKKDNNSLSLVVVVTIAVAVPVSVAVIIIISAFVVWRRRIKGTKQIHTEITMEEKGEQQYPQLQEEKDQQDLKTVFNPNYSPSPVSVDMFADYAIQAKNDNFSQLAFEFQQIEKIELQFPSTVAEKPKNKRKNRYINIIPYDNTRVVLEKTEGDEDSDYINASYIRGFDGTVSYISCQGPIHKTVADFWRMIWQEKTSVIVMLTEIAEDGKIKCQKYWPDWTDSYHDVTVELRSVDVFADYVVRMFNVSKSQGKTDEQRCVFHYHFIAWPDMDVPDPTALLNFRNRIASDTVMTIPSPWVVHCSAGVGRTGVFLAIDAMLRQAQEKKTIDVFNYVKTMRESRPYMVQNEEQYLCIYAAIHEYLAGGVTEIRAEHLRKSMRKLAVIDKKENISGFEKEFKNLLSVCPAVEEDNATSGNQTCNAAKNRFPHILPLDRTRVILQVDEITETSEDEDPGYINASYVKGYRKKYEYILTQAPLDNTIVDFWKMIYDKRLGTIVMLNRLREADMAVYPKYWPTQGLCQYGDIVVETVSENIQGDLATRKFHLVHRTGESEDDVLQVVHFQHLDWRNGSVPTNEKTVLDLVKKIQQSQQQSKKKPIVVQCSDGVGRSGTLCTILSLLDRVKTEEIIDVFQIVKVIRKSRPGAVESLVQYRFCFEVVMAYLKSFSEYSNFNG